MSARRLSRAAGDGRPPAPVRLAHLGLGNFFRAHQAWYTEHAPDAAEWGHAAWAGRSEGVAATLGAQDCLYTVIVRGPERDDVDLVSAVSEAHPASDHRAWLDALASPRLAAVTMTVTEAGYVRSVSGGLDVTRPSVAADLARLRADLTAPVTTAPARLVAGLAARRRACAGPLALVPCDNVPANGALVRQVVGELADRIDPALAVWISETVDVVTTVVDRITPGATAQDAVIVRRRTGRADGAVVVTEPYSEWILAGRFPAGRPAWERAGARVVQDVTPFEHRKLWLLNGAHSLLAYAGSIRGHTTVAQAVADDSCRAWIEHWWSEASCHLDQDTPELLRYQDALMHRFANLRLDDRLARIAEDGSQKLPGRVLAVVRLERSAGRMPTGAARILAAWICHLRGMGAPVRDVRALELVPAASGPYDTACRSVLSALDPALGEDSELLGVVAELCRDLETAGA